jgi:hypothetical protein
LVGGSNPSGVTSEEKRPQGRFFAWALSLQKAFKAMDIALKKLELMQQLMLIWDEAALERVAKAIGTEVPDLPDLSPEEMSELDRRRERHLKGEGRSYTMEESIARLRKIGK